MPSAEPVAHPNESSRMNITEPISEVYIRPEDPGGLGLLRC